MDIRPIAVIRSTFVWLTVKEVLVVLSIQIMRVLEQDSFRRIADSLYKIEATISH